MQLVRQGFGDGTDAAVQWRLLAGEDQVERQAGRAPQRPPGETGRLYRGRGFSGRGKGDPVAQVTLRDVERDRGRAEPGVWPDIPEQRGQLIVDHGVGRTVRKPQRIRGRVGDLDLRAFGQRMVLRRPDPDARTPQRVRSMPDEPASHAPHRDETPFSLRTQARSSR